MALTSAPSKARPHVSARAGSRLLFATLRMLVVVLACLPTVAGPRLLAQQAAIATRAESAIARTDALDAGALAGSQQMTFTVHLASNSAHSAALDHLLSAQTERSSPDYHHWLSTSEFAAAFAPSDEAVSALTNWFTANGLTVSGRSASGMRLMVSGPAAAVERALTVPLRRMAISGRLYVANQGSPKLPGTLNTLVSSISGLDDLPSTTTHRLQLGTQLPSQVAVGFSTARAGEQSSNVEAAANTATDVDDVIAAVAAVVDANTSPVLTLSSELCSNDLSTAERAELNDSLRQAQAQGMTVLVAGSCTQGDDVAFPSALAAVTAVTLAPVAAAAAPGAGLEARPIWQAADGLPADTLRHAPDFTATSLDSLARTVTTLVRETGARIGGLSSTLYPLAKSSGLFTQAVSAGTPASAGEWTSTAGLGLIDLDTLLKIYPRGGIATSTSLVSSSYALGYGDSFTLTSTVQPASYGASSPSGTITFTASSQGVLGTAVLSNGSATLTQTVLPVGTYSVTATYSGDGLYTGSSSTSQVTITVSIVNAKVTASIAPQLNVPYGATATVTATVALPGANATPSTTVTAQIEAVTGALYTATLSPNSGGNTATANIIISVPPPQTQNYTVQVTCLGTSNYQCQSPVNLLLNSVKGYTNTTISVSPAAPQAGQPIALTATVANSGNGTASYVFTGSIAFYDSGKLLTTVPVATNQATTTATLSGNRTHNITAVYTGDSNWNTSTSGAAAVSPTILPDLLTLTSNVASGTSLAGVNIIFTGTATTTVTYGVGPTGTVTFFDTFNGAVVQLGNPAPMVSNGPTASIGLFTTTGLLPGVHSIYAVYSGDDNYASSTSPVLQLSLSSFNVSMTPTSLTLAQGKSQQVTVLVSSSGGFAGTVSLGCVPPASSQATCSFSPAAITGGGATVLTITTTAASASSDLRKIARRSGEGPSGIAGAVSLAALLCFMSRRSRKAMLRLGPGGLVVLLLASTLVLSSMGCGLGVLGSDSGNNSGDSSGSSGSGSTASSGTPLGTQNFTITAGASDGVNTVSHTYAYQVTVQ